MPHLIFLDRQTRRLDLANSIHRRRKRAHLLLAAAEEHHCKAGIADLKAVDPD
jgi:hypothetical protein